MIKKLFLHKEDDVNNNNLGSGIQKPAISTEVTDTEKVKEKKPNVIEKEKPKPETSEENTVFISFYKTSKEGGWSLFPKVSISPEQAENRVKAHVSIVDLSIIPVELP